MVVIQLNIVFVRGAFDRLGLLPDQIVFKDDIGDYFSEFDDIVICCHGAFGFFVAALPETGALDAVV